MWFQLILNNNTYTHGQMLQPAWLKKDSPCNLLWWVQRPMAAQDTRVSDTWMLHPKQDTYAIPSLKFRALWKRGEGFRIQKMRRKAINAILWAWHTEPLQPWSVSQHLQLPVQDRVSHLFSKGRRGTQQDHTPFCWTIVTGRLWKTGSLWFHTYTHRRAARLQWIV